jgi:hypothetical protein
MCKTGFRLPNIRSQGTFAPIYYSDYCRTRTSNHVQAFESVLRVLGATKSRMTRARIFSFLRFLRWFFSTREEACTGTTRSLKSLTDQTVNQRQERRFAYLRGYSSTVQGAKINESMSDYERL